LSPSTIALARAHFPALAEKLGIFVWHPTFNVKRGSMRGQQWRERHGISSDMNLLAFIGAIKGYKGIEELVSSFTATSDQKLRLVIAGQISNPTDFKNLSNAKEIDDRILLEIKFLTDDEFEEIALAADQIVLPFKKILHSGSLVYALSCGKPVLTPEEPFAKDYQSQVGKHWIKTYTRPLSAETLSAAINPPEKSLDLDFLSITASGRKLKDFYMQIMNREDTAKGT
jgi:glycosyltransferase involved in cell wall biosynthesis